MSSRSSQIRQEAETIEDLPLQANPARPFTNLGGFGRDAQPEIKVGFNRKLMKSIQSNISPRTCIPITVLQETMLTLNLLFPHWDPLTDAFMTKHDQNFHLQRPLDDSRPLHLADFHHWRNRLLELHQIFHSPPVGWAQMWADRRNPLQWYTFWIATVILILTIIFGLISSVTGIMQTCIAYEGLKLARLENAREGDL